MSNTAKAATVAGVVAGAAMIYQGTSGQDEHSGWDVATGAAGGATAGAAIGSVIPGVGTAIGAGIGAAVGGVISGSQLFSETDCLHDPITGKFTCCNTVFNQGERQVNIGGYMFCGVEKDGKIQAIAPGVRQCLQGTSDKELGWWDSLWEDDSWTPECTPRFCNGETEPAAGTTNFVDWIPDTSNICWKWKCKGEYVRQGNTCVSSGNGAGNDGIPAQEYNDGLYDALIQRIEALRQQIIKDCGQIMSTSN